MKTQTNYDELYRVAPFVRFPLLPTADAVYFPLTGAVCNVAPLDVQVLSSCTSFKSLDQHASDATRQFPSFLGGGDQTVSSFLARVQEQGGFLSQSELTARCGLYSDRGASASSIKWLAIPTSGDVSHLRRALRSYVNNALSNRRTFEIFIADDCRSSEKRLDLQAAIREIAAASLVRIVYAGEEEKQSFAAKLSAVGAIPYEVVKCALFGFYDGSITTGANRNAILLGTIGSLVLSVDDDTICDAARISSEDGSNTIFFQAEGDFQEYWYYASPQQARDAILPFKSNLDVAGHHETLLGRYLHDIVADGDLTHSADMNLACVHLLDSMLRGSGRVVVTSNGAVGDSGAHSHIPHLVNPASIARHRLGTSEADYKIKSRTREIIRQSPSYMIGHNMSIQMMFAGIDNRTLLPPFCPGYRNQDGIFAQTVSMCVKDACIGHIPLVLEHSPTDVRAYGSDDSGKLRVCNLIMACITSWRVEPGDDTTDKRLRSLGQHLQHLSSLSETDFKALVLPILLAERSAFLRIAQQTIRSAAYQPEFWVRDVTDQLSTLSCQIFDTEYLKPVDISSNLSLSQSLSHIQGLLNRLGGVLYWWPRIVETTRELLLQGTSLGRDVV